MLPVSLSGGGVGWGVVRLRVGVRQLYSGGPRTFIPDILRV